MLKAREPESVTEFVVNGTPVRITGDHPHLLSALREELGVVSAKDGCSPSGQCGCCTVLVDGKAVVSCNLALDRVEGAEITTLEGIDAEQRDRMAAAFASTGALQCGFCTPGILVRTASLLEKKGAGLDRTTAARHLGAHLCRCTGYVKILDAVELLAKGDRPDRWRSGASAPAARATRGSTWRSGTKHYVDDLRVDGMLHGALHLAAHARADVLAIDATAAAVVDGVVGVFTGADVPGELKVGLIHKDWPVFIPVGGRTSYLGDVLAIVVAETARLPRRAAALVEVEYAPLPPITDPAAAVASDEDAVWGLDGNVLSRSVYAAGRRRCRVRGERARGARRYQTQRIEHAFLEPESTLAVPSTTGACTCTPAARACGTTATRSRRCSALDAERITVELVSNGGAFGGKEDMSNQAQTALAAWLLGRPVKCTLRREESLLLHPKRHPVRIDLEVGCDADGRLTALRARMLGDSGPYASVGMKVLERAAGHASGPYRLPAIDVEAVAARTNNSVCGAFRGFGANQAQFAMEGAARPPRRPRRHQRVGDPQPQRRRSRRRVGTGPDHGRRLPRRPPVPRRAEARVRGGAGRGPRGGHRARA